VVYDLHGAAPGRFSSQSQQCRSQRSGRPADIAWRELVERVFRTSNAVYQELAEGITTRRLDAKRVYLHDRPGELDPTLCVLNFAPILAIAQRRKDYGPSIGRLLATVAPEVPEQPRPPRETKRNAVQRYIAHIYPEGIPAGVTNKEIARATKVSPRTVQRALHSAPQPQKGQRC
jgi:hypothetical protein